LIRIFGRVQVLAAAALCAAAGAAFGQSSDIAPYLHTPPSHPTRHAAKAKKTVPVVAPHHARQVRRPPPRTATAQVAKPEPPLPKPAPKKPPVPPLPADVGPNSGLHLPRYAALKSDQVNMRAGPGERYPILWTYQRRDLPVKIEQELDIWRQVEDMDGIKGWMQEGFLAGHRSLVVTGTEDRVLRADPADTADPVAILKPGVVGRIRACDAGKDWCQVQIQDYRGWLKRSDFWGVDAGEAISP
jgi:SH3-like domain-containing protein